MPKLYLATVSAGLLAIAIAKRFGDHGHICEEAISMEYSKLEDAVFHLQPS